MQTLKNTCCLLFIAGWLLSCTNGDASKTTEKKDKLCISDSLAKIIHIDTAGIANIDDQLKLSGEISFNDNKVVKVFPFSSGQVLEVKVSVGDKVAKGQTLAIIKSADVAGNYSDLSTTGNDVAISKKQLDNTESLYKNGIASEREYLEAKENYNKAVATANKVKEMIAINGGGHTTANGTYVITAPMSGYVVEKKISQGGFIRNDNNDNLFTIGDISDVWVWANVYESDIAKVKEGYKAKVTTLAYPDSAFIGVVDKVNQILDPVTKVMKIRVRLPNPGMRLKPEMFANIVIDNKEGRKMVMLPSDGVISDNGKNFVIVYHDKCNLELREITVLQSVNGKDFVSAGIKEGELVVGQNQVLLFNALKEE
ncbi:MAG TPA: efflux RND transporter periplasmic adaptor subunit [Chitinophagaceae bacterium]|jgi:cobalt-zinc-cadmium efflux system membrane fusion protein|nr:efflux RND transporter periplasmic adaptor subunit [Chitinophagaceae bacterium]